MLGETGPGGTLAEVYAVRGLRGRASLPSDGPSFNEDNPEPFRSRILPASFATSSTTPCHSDTAPFSPS